MSRAGWLRMNGPSRRHRLAERMHLDDPVLHAADLS